MKIEKLFYPTILCILLTACSQNGEASTVPIISSSSGSTTSLTTSSTTTTQTTTFQPDPSDINLFAGVYTDLAPQIVEPYTEMKVKYDEENSCLYYKLFEDGEYKDISSGDTISLDYLKYTNKTYYPITTHVIPDPTGTGSADKLISYDYINNIYNNGNYVLKQKMPVVYFKYEDAEGNITEKSFTYPVQKDFDFDNIPVVCLTLKYNDMYSYSSGIYNAIREDRKVRGLVEYFDKANNEYFARETQVKLGGNYSKGYPQRTLNLNFTKNDAGDKNEPVKANIYLDTPTCGDETKLLTDLTRFRLHNGGNCFEERTGFNDAMMHDIMRNTNIATTAARPCLVFINGEYWGLMTIREHYSDTFFNDNYGVKKSNVVLFEYVYNPDTDHWVFDDGNETNANKYINELKTYINNNDFTNDDVYNTFINQYIDVDSFIDLFIVESFSANWDFVGNINNLKMWRVDNADGKTKFSDGKWRFCLHDIDFACDGQYSTVFLSNNDTSKFDYQYHYKKFPMYNALAQNKNFRMKFIARAQELIKDRLSKENLSNTVDKFYNLIKDYKIESQIRWGKRSSYETEWKNIISSTKSWMNNRSDEYMSKIIASLSSWGEIE